MKTKKTLINILWDASPLWGHLVLNAVAQTGLSYKVITAKDCAEGALNAQDTKILIVPGGSGRFKAQILGEKGVRCIRDFVEAGGTYLGFCGGAGLALSDEQGGLGICPWGRNFYRDRTQHLISGHIVSELFAHDLLPKAVHNTKAPLPVWWPGRFEEPKSPLNADDIYGEVSVLARYQDMGKDFHWADLAINKLPVNTLEDWRDLYDVNLRPSLLDGQPAIISGSFGKGRYLLSYSHLETPDSPEANSLLAHIFREALKGENPDELRTVAPKTIDDIKHIEIFSEDKTSALWEEKNYVPTWLNLPTDSAWQALEKLSYDLQEVFDLGVELGLLFARTEWLYGWHNAVPGSQLNALRVALARSLCLPPTASRLEFMKKNEETLCQDMGLFLQGAKSWLLAKRLSDTIADAEFVPKHIMQEQRKELFGVHMLGGGACGSLIDLLDEFLFLTA